MLECVRQSSAMTLASSKVWDTSIARSLSRSVPLNASTKALCQGGPGSMRTDPVVLKRHQPGIAWQVVFGPLSIATNLGCPCTLVRRSRTRTRSSLVMDRPNLVANSVLVNSAVRVKTLNTHSSAV